MQVISSSATELSPKRDGPSLVSRSSGNSTSSAKFRSLSVSEMSAVLSICVTSISVFMCTMSETHFEIAQTSQRHGTQFNICIFGIIFISIIFVIDGQKKLITNLVLATGKYRSNIHDLQPKLRPQCTMKQMRYVWNA